MAGEGREDTTQQAPPVDQPTDESPALSFDPGPQVVDTTAVEEPVEQPPVRGAEEQVAPTGGPEHCQSTSMWSVKDSWLAITSRKA